jgi:hypothetical protein
LIVLIWLHLADQSILIKLLPILSRMTLFNSIYGYQQQAAGRTHLYKFILVFI